MPHSDLQRRLTGLGAPEELVAWAWPFPDLDACWHACPSAQWLLWLAARLSTSGDERRAIVSCLAELTKRAERAGRCIDAAAATAVENAVDAAALWARTESSSTVLPAAGLPAAGLPSTGLSSTGPSLDDLVAAEQAALAVAARALVIADEEGARARSLFYSAPRTRPASFATSSALGAWVAWRKADYTSRLALAAAGTARAAAEAAWIDAIHDRTAFPPPQPGAPWRWVSCAADSADYAVQACAIAEGGRHGDKTVRKSVRLIRQHLACPQLG
jgi:hypothetical protein